MSVLISKRIYYCIWYRTQVTHKLKKKEKTIVIDFRFKYYIGPHPMTFVSK